MRSHLRARPLRVPTNPYAPSFGNRPPLLAGRDDVVERFIRGLASGPGAQERVMLIRGPRAIGKTSVLNELEDRARAAGWLVVQETATDNFVERLRDVHFARVLLDTTAPRGPEALKSITIERAPGFGWEYPYQLPPPRITLRWQLETLTQDPRIAQHGLMISLDEIQGGSIEELREFGNTLQLLRRATAPIAVAMAGIETGVQTLIDDKASSFLRRAYPVTLHPIDDDAAVRALATPAKDAGRPMTPEAAQLAAARSAGWPFLIQLIGASVWEVDPSMPAITIDHVQAALPDALSRFAEVVYQPQLKTLSPRARAYLVAMSTDQGQPSKLATLKIRLGWTKTVLYQHTKRLRDAGIIRTSSWGAVETTMPGLAQFAALADARPRSPEPDLADFFGPGELFFPAPDREPSAGPDL
ncbi:MAG: ATP-binding protein [Actinomycetota bacterium]|nr:ATP-binding protein [Actinomycetota bacterium]